MPSSLPGPAFNTGASSERAAAARAPARATSEAASAVTFEHEVLPSGASRDFIHEQYSWGRQILPRHGNKNALEGDFLHHVAGTARPLYPVDHALAGAPMTTQWLVFKFRSEGIFTGTFAHIAVALRAQSTATWNRGRGFIIGHQNLSSDDPNVCPVGEPGTAHVQPETWWTSMTATAQMQRQYVWGPPLCSAPKVRDFKDYLVGVHVADGGHMAYRLTAIETGESFSTSLQDTVNGESVLVDGLTGYTIALVFGANQLASWRLHAYEIASGWF